MTVTELVAVDLGGTHARFAIAELRDGQVSRLDTAVTLRTADHTDLRSAWAEFERRQGRRLPAAAAIAVAAPTDDPIIRMTNNSWSVVPADLDKDLSLDTHIVLNDFVALGHSLALLGEDAFEHLCGPESPLSRDGVISIVGPGTGLGVGQVLGRHGRCEVIATEGGHINFAPCDSIDDAILRHLRKSHARVSAERVVSGPGLANIYEALCAIEGRPVPARSNAQIWESALTGTDAVARTALERFCLSLGATAGDIALAQGGSAVVIAGGVGRRLADFLPRSGFRDRFVAKGRFEQRMARMPVKILTHPHPGLLGAAAAYASSLTTAAVG